MSSSTPLVVAACKGRLIVLMKKIMLMLKHKGHTSVIKALLENPGTKVNQPVSGGWTALMWAAW